MAMRVVSFSAVRTYFFPGTLLKVKTNEPLVLAENIIADEIRKTESW